MNDCSVENLRRISFCVLVGALFINNRALSQNVTWIVSSRAGERLNIRPPLEFGPEVQFATNTFRVEDSKTFQTVIGFGASFLEAGLICLNSLPREKQEEVLRSLFDVTNGAGFSVMKTPLAGTDFMSAGEYYTYDDTPGDVEMKHFTIARDLKKNGAITYIRRARKYGRFLLQAPMDYPPDWMLIDLKTNQDVNPKYYDALARYYARYLEEYERQGVHIDYLSLFNEPGIYTKIRYSEIRDLLVNHVVPLLKKLHFNTHLMLAEPPCRECAWNEYSAVLDAETRKCISALAFHGYNFDKFDALVRLHGRFPDLPLWMTEICHSTLAGTYKKMVLPRYDFEDGDFWGRQIFSDMEAGVSAWIYWNMILDAKGGPWMVSEIHADPDRNVQHPLVIINRDTHKVTYTGCYYYLAHFSKYVRPGAVRIEVKGVVGNVRCLSFRSSDGQMVIELMNSNNTARKVCVEFKNRSLILDLPSLSISTCLWRSGSVHVGK